jgi:hypothetical protein
MKLQNELDGFVNALPPAFKMRNPDKSQDHGMSPCLGRADDRTFLVTRTSIHVAHGGPGYYYYPTCTSLSRIR